MRSYSTLKPSFWQAQSESRHILQSYDESELLLYIYLLTSPHSHLSGIYTCPSLYIANETGMTLQAVRDCLHNLSDIGLVHIDETCELIWLPQMIHHAVGKMAVVDNRYKGIKTHIESLPPSILIEKFCLANDFQVPNRSNKLKPLPSPLEAPPKGTSLTIKCNGHNPTPETDAKNREVV